MMATIDSAICRLRCSITFCGAVLPESASAAAIPSRRPSCASTNMSCRNRMFSPSICPFTWSVADVFMPSIVSALRRKGQQACASRFRPEEDLLAFVEALKERVG